MALTSKKQSIIFKAWWGGKSVAFGVEQMLFQILVLLLTCLSSWASWPISLYLSLLTCTIGMKLTLTSVLELRDNIHKWLTFVPGTHVLNKQEILFHKVWKW